MLYFKVLVTNSGHLSDKILISIFQADFFAKVHRLILLSENHRILYPFLMRNLTFWPPKAKNTRKASIFHEKFCHHASRNTIFSYSVLRQQKKELSFQTIFHKEEKKLEWREWKVSQATLWRICPKSCHENVFHFFIKKSLYAQNSINSSQMDPNWVKLCFKKVKDHQPK